MSSILATVGNLAASPWYVTGLSPQDSARMLAFASRLVTRATMSATYNVDSDGMPTDTILRNALRDATCSQAATWAALNINPAKGAADAGNVIASKSRGAASIQYAVYASTVLERARAATQLSLDARIILAEAGLIGSPTVIG
jgi:hypothetical protein